MTKGIDFKFNAPFRSIEKKDDGTFTVHLEGCDPIEADAVLMATGRTPNTKGLGLEEAGVELDDKGAIKVDERNQSSAPSIFAVGDVTDRIQLTRVAIREGQALADSVFGDKQHVAAPGNVPTQGSLHTPLGAVGRPGAGQR